MFVGLIAVVVGAYVTEVHHRDGTDNASPAIVSVSPQMPATVQPQTPAANRVWEGTAANRALSAPALPMVTSGPAAIPDETTRPDQASPNRAMVVQAVAVPLEPPQTSATKARNSHSASNHRE
jgi:hypothetical protein